VTAEDVRELAGLREFAARAAARWRAIDSLLPVPVPAERGAGCGAELVVGSGGRLAAFGTCPGPVMTTRPPSSPGRAGTSTASPRFRYEQLNPYAAAFWSRQRYRPLWTMWEARPALSLR
jgi:hypothetical protein